MPNIFTTYKPDNDKESKPLQLELFSRLHGDSRYSVFKAYAEGVPDQIPGGLGNCVAKLVFDHYGLAVHKALAPRFAPKFYGHSSREGTNAKIFVMECLPIPEDEEEWDGMRWIMLATLPEQLNTPRLDPHLRNDIYVILKDIVLQLKDQKLVHGDLRSNNLMIKMVNPHEVAKPVEIKVIDFEWADELGLARYPYDRNNAVGYPGNAAALIAAGDDLLMVEKWAKQEVESVN